MKKRRSAAKRKPKDILVGRDPTMQLYRAVRRYVQSKGGALVMIGGVEVQEWPEDRNGMFRVAVRLLGRKPVLVEASK